MVLSVCRQIEAAGGTAQLVGGAVRDALLGLPVKDFDLEVYGLTPEALRETLKTRFPLDLVGESFGVLKLKGQPIDVALPRRESKSGHGHRGFEVFSDPSMSPEEAASRRDFTINSMAWRPLEDRLIDPFGGRRDLAAGILRHTSDKFSEDPLRVLRGMQFVARFDLETAPETLSLCRSMSMASLARERLWQEWLKYLLRGRAMLRGLRFLVDTGWVEHFPEIAALIGCQQDLHWHPEGDVFVHTGHVLDAFARTRILDDEEDSIVGLACLCHDFGKPATTVFEQGRWRSPGHEPAGAAPTREFLARLTDQRDLADQIVPLVEHHLKPRQLFDARATPAAIRRLARKVGRIDRLLRVARADAGGRPPLAPDCEASDWLEERANELAVRDAAPRPLLQGRHLIERGLTPGPDFGAILEQLFEAQLDGTFGDLDSGLVYLDRYLASRDRG